MEMFQRAKIQYLVRIADQYWGTARLMWILGGMHPAMHNLNQAVELYLRAAWLSGQTFTDEAAMNKGLRDFHKSDKGKSHDYASMLERLPQPVKDAMKTAKIKGFTLTNDAVSRYGDGVGMSYSEAMLREVDLFIKVIRQYLGYDNPKSNYEIIIGGTNVMWPGNQRVAENGVKTIVSSTNVLSKKKQFKILKKRIAIAHKRYKQQTEQGSE